MDSRLWPPKPEEAVRFCRELPICVIDIVVSVEVKEEDLERMEVMGSYLNLLTEMISPLIQSASESDNSGRDLACLSVALLVIARTAMEPFSTETQMDLRSAAISLFETLKHQNGIVSH